MKKSDQVEKFCWAAALDENGLEVVITFFSEESRAAFIERANHDEAFPFSSARAITSEQAAIIGSEQFEGGEDA